MGLSKAVATAKTVAKLTVSYILSFTAFVIMVLKIISAKITPKVLIGALAPLLIKPIICFIALSPFRLFTQFVSVRSIEKSFKKFFALSGIWSLISSMPEALYCSL